MQKTEKPMPSRELRGRPPKFRLHELVEGEGYEIPLNEEEVRGVRGSLFSSASHYGLKIKTTYSNGTLWVWRLK
jgi:hypothetical protein